MRRRRADTETVSLFSFQDIMASVIGILFFVVMMMSLSIVNEASPDTPQPSPEGTSPELSTLRQNVSELRAELARLEARAAEVSDKLTRAATFDEGSVRRELEQLRSNLTAMYRTIGEEEKKLQEVVSRSAPKLKEIEDTRKRLQDIEDEIAKCKARLRGAQSVARIAFIIDKHPGGLEPWLLEVSKDRIRVGTKDAGSAVEFRADSPEEREGLFLAWAKNQDTRAYYFVILLKPSGTQIVQGLYQRINAMGFEIGMDLLPEDWQPY